MRVVKMRVEQKRNWYVQFKQSWVRLVGTWREKDDDSFGDVDETDYLDLLAHHLDELADFEYVDETDD